MSEDVRGRTQAERERQRRWYVTRAIAEAQELGVTIRCADAAREGDEAAHRMCQGESKGNSGCLCRCHDGLPDGRAR